MKVHHNMSLQEMGIQILSRDISDLFENEVKVIKTSAKTSNGCCAESYSTSSCARDMITKARNCIFKVKLNQIVQSGYQAYEVHINWTKNILSVYDTLEDVMSHNPSQMISMFNVTASPIVLPVKHMMAEIFMFLHRGHSWMHPDCSCDIRSYIHSKARLKTLGYYNKYKSESLLQACPLLNMNREGQSMHSVMTELGLKHERSIMLNITSRARDPFLNYLEKFGKFNIYEENGKMWLHHSMCCVPMKIQSKRDVEEASKIQYPRPFTWLIPSNAPIIKNVYENILKEKENAQVRIIASATSIDVNKKETATFSVFYKNPEIERLSACAVDQDIKDMWHQIKGTKACEMQHVTKKSKKLKR